MNSNTLASKGLRLQQPMLPEFGGSQDPIDGRHPPLCQIVAALFLQLLTHRRKNFGGLNDY